MKLIAVLLVIIAGVLLYTVYLLKTNSTKEKNASATSQQDDDMQSNNSPREVYNAAPGSSKKSNNKKYRTTKKMKWCNRMLDISMIPKTVELDKETLLPLSINRAYGYGRRFNNFITNDGDEYYHRSRCSKIKGKTKKPIHKYMTSYMLVPCPLCNPHSTVDEWYISFLKTNFKNINTFEDFQKQMKLSDPNLPMPEAMYKIKTDES